MNKLSRRHLLGTAAALLAAGLAACGGSGSDSDPQPTTTLLVYLLGSNLEREANAGTANLLEMLAAKGSSRTRIIITTGGADKVDPAGLVTSWKTVKRFELAHGQLKELADLGVQNMAAGSTLQDFVSWGVGTYPAERTMLMLWDHGSGYQGFGGDENFPRSEWAMSMHTMAAALQGAKAATGVTLDYIGFDACLMATLEVAKMLQPYARYLGASQELEPGTGWDWKAVVEAASRESALSIPEFGQVAATAFYEKQKISAQGANWVTFSIIDLERIPTLLERLDQWANAVQAYYDNAPDQAKASSASIFWPPMFQAPRPITKFDKAAPSAFTAAAAAITENDSVKRWKQIAMARLSTLAFGGVKPLDKEYFSLIDMGQFATLLSEQGIAAGPQAALQQALQEAVLFNITGPRIQSANGLSIFFPLGQIIEPVRELYDTFNMPAGYIGLLERHTQQAQQTPSVISVAPLQTEGTSIVGSIASLYGVQDAELMQVQPVSANVVKVTGTLPLVSGASLRGNTYGLVEFSTSSWLQLDGQPLLLYTLSRNTNKEGTLDSALLGAPVRLHSHTGNSAARTVVLLIQYQWDPNTGMAQANIIGAHDIDFDDPDAPPDRVDQEIFPGDTVEPMHILYDLQTQEFVREPDGSLAIDFGQPITLTSRLALRPQPLAAGTHTLILNVTDLADEDALSPPLTITMA